MVNTLQDRLASLSGELRAVEELFERELQSDLACVSNLTRHLSRFRGKMLRPMLLLLTGKAVGEVGSAHVTLATVVEMVHMATLVHDDVLDDAELRRRGATINHLKGNEAAVLLGDYLISHSYHLCSALADQFAARAIAATTNRVCEGELLQLENRGNLELDEATYTQIISRKTADLIATSSMLGARYAGGNRSTVESMNQFGLCLGIAFQIQDDVLDLVGDSDRVGKRLGGDVEKAKLTLPLIHFLRTAPHEHRQLLRVLLRGNEPDRAEKVANLIAPSGSVEYARGVARRYMIQASQCLEGLRESEHKSALSEIAQFVIDRSL